VQANLTEALGRLAHLRDDVLPLELALLTEPELATRRRELVRQLPSRDLPGPHGEIAGYLRAEQALGRIGEHMACEPAARSRSGHDAAASG
jgi:hypothetical protein